MTNPAPRTPVRPARVLTRTLTGLAATGLAVLALGTSPATAASHHPAPQPRSVGSTLTNTVTAPNSNCVNGTETGCTTATVVSAPVAPMMNPEIAAGMAAAVGLGLLARRRRTSTR